MDYEQIEVEDRGAIRVITLSRPEKLNAWTRQMSREMVHAIDDGNDSDAIGAFVFTGSGRAFCAGADIGGEFASRTQPSGDGGSGGEGSGQEQSQSSDQDRRDWVGLVRESKPMVAAINGPAIGVGLTLALPMDYLMAGASARLSARFVKMGLVPELASSHFLVQRCGWGGASDLALSGRIVEADEALAAGLVDAVVPDDELVDAAVTRAQSYAENPPTALRMIKELLTANGSATDLAEIQQRELARLNEAYTSPDHKEAVAAFLEKREPRFR
jgi:2-(1,2-epoxy-1,2-dihydrophenyl)acetyl-CoA isomerase